MSNNTLYQRGRLALVPEPASAPVPAISFCSHCGARPSAPSRSRVCASCEMGLVLQAGADIAPPVGGAFIVIDSSLSVCAVSNAAERLLDACETEAVNRHVTELLVPADAEAQGAQNLAVAVTWAARGEQGPSRVVVRPTNTYGVRLSARIGSCGPPTAALIAFDPTSGH